MIKPNFYDLLGNYSTKSTSIHKCSMHFPHTCAIRMSEALVKTDSAFLEVFKAAATNKCPHSYIRGPQDLAAILAKPTVMGPRTYGWTANPAGKSPQKIQGKKGIVCYMKIPGYSGQGHIDLWNADRPVGSQYWESKTIWFWELPS